MSAERHTSPRGRAERLVRVRASRELAVFMLAGLIALALIGIGSIVAIRHVARVEAQRDAERTTARLANLVVGPLLRDVLAGKTSRRDELDRVVANRLRDGSIKQITVWSANGQIVYADEASQIDRRFATPPEVRAAIERNQVSTRIKEAADLGDHQPPGALIEVFVPLRLSGMPALAFESYYPVQRVEGETNRLFATLLPLTLGSLMLLQLVQVPIAWSLSRRVRRQQEERVRLSERALVASDRERQRIAADLHDGVVQDLAGASYAMEAVSRSVPAEQRPTLDTLGEVLRGAVESLRRLMVDVYPPDLSGPGLASALADLADPLRANGIDVSLRFGALPELDPVVSAMLYRTAREALTNVSKHAAARTVSVSLTQEEGRPPSGGVLLLSIADDGVGLPPDGIERRGDGHLGLRLVIDSVAQLGGELVVQAGNTGGTSVIARLPARSAARS